jgi:hypothetical protein
MSYISRHATRKTGASAELMYLLIVLVAGIATAWWAGHRLGMDLSSITTAASVLGFTETGRLSHGAAGYTAQAHAEQSITTAPFCNPGQLPSFAPGVATLQQKLGDVMGAPVECEHAVTATGDTIQQTTTGLVAYNSLTNTVSFTDGWRHWAVAARGFVAWEGPESDPPAG